MEIFENLTTLDVDIKLEDYSGKLLLTFETPYSDIQLVITKEQLNQLRVATQFTNEELNEMAKSEEIHQKP